MSIAFNFGAAMAGIHSSLGPVITQRLRAAAPGHGPQHGEHIATITHRTSLSALQWVGAFKPWGFVVRRTKPHLILPTKEGGVLAFEAKDGSLVFRRHVNHPGTQANRFPMRVWRESMSEVGPILKSGVRAGLVIRQVNPYRATLL